MSLATILQFDSAMLDFISHALGGYSTFFVFITALFGFLGTICFIVVGFLLFRRYVSLSWATLYALSVTSIALTSNSLKNVFGRIRPSGSLTVENSFSFPSSHAAISSAIGIIVIMWAIKEKRLSNKIKGLIIILSLTFIFVIGLSRIVLRVHYPIDVLGGWVLSVCIIFILEKVISRLNS